MTQARTSTTQARGDRTRARLLEAAVQAFAAKGFHATSTRDIATAAGLSPAAVYVHHRSKEELLHAIAVRGHEVILEALTEALRADSTPAERVAAAVRTYVLFHARSHTMARVINYELAALTEEHFREVAGLRRAIDTVMRDVVEEGVRSGDFDTPDAAKTATALLSLGIDLARWYRDDGSWTPESLADFYADLALRVVGARP